MSNNKNLKVLSELVEQSNIPFTTIVLYLANEGLLEQYYTELDLKKQYTIEPTITEEEFNRIVSGGVKKGRKTKKDNKKEES
jgi:hypothetical protein